MTNHDAFLTAIREHPDDDTPRLVYADFLDEHGEPERAEFIRVQCGWAREATDTPRRRSLWDREKRLLEGHRERWLEPLRSILDKPPPFLARFRRVLESFVFHPRIEGDIPWHNNYNVQFRRGFVESLTLTTAEFLAHADALFRAAPVLLALGVFIESPKDAVDLFDSSFLSGLTELIIHDDVSGQPTVERLTSCAHLGRLTKLALSSPLLNDACVHTLANAALLEQLTALSLFTWRYVGQSEWLRGTLGDEAARILAASPCCHKLMVLNLDDNRIGDTGAAALAASPHLVQLQTLVLSRNDVGPEGSALLKTRFGNRVHL